MDNFLFFLVSGICIGAIYALIALGYTLVYGIIKLINFAHGEFYMLGAYVGFFFYTKALPAGLTLWVSIPLVLFVAGAAGAGIAVLSERIAYKPIRGKSRLSALLTAIGISFLLQTAFTFVYNGNSLSFDGNSAVAKLCQRSMRGDRETEEPENPPPTLTTSESQTDVDEKDKKPRGNSIRDIRQVKFAFILITAVLMAFLWFVVMRTRFGRAMRATSQDLDAARLMGINVDRVIMLTFAMGGFFAGVAGMLYGALGTISPQMGLLPGLIAFVAAVIGGIGSIPGAVLGGFLVGILQSLVLWAGAPSEFRNVIVFVLLIVVLVVRPQGILGKRERVKV